MQHVPCAAHDCPGTFELYLLRCAAIRETPKFRYVCFCCARCWCSRGCRKSLSAGTSFVRLMKFRCSVAMQLVLAAALSLVLALSQQCDVHSLHQEIECLQVIRPCALRSKLNLAAACMPQRRALRTRTIAQSQYTKQEKVHIVFIALCEAVQSLDPVHCCRVTVAPQTSVSSSRTKVRMSYTATSQRHAHAIY